MRLRAVQRADLAAIGALEGCEGFRFERPATDAATGIHIELLEHRGAIVGASKYRVFAIAPPSYSPEPLPSIRDFVAAGSEPALIGEGFLLDPTLDPTQLARAHRLCRTLRADQEGLQYTVCRAPLPAHPVFDPAGTAQQIAAGAIDWQPVTTLLRDGYWPAAVADDRSVWLVREATWL